MNKVSIDSITGFLNTATTSFKYVFLILLLLGIDARAQEYDLHSPNGKINMNVNIGDTISYSLEYANEEVLSSSPLYLQFLHAPPLGMDLKVITNETKTIDHSWENAFGQHRSIRNHYNELHLKMIESRFPGRKLEMFFRAYNDGIAYRYVIQDMQKNTEKKHILLDEYSSFHFPKDHIAWVSTSNNGYTSSQEAEFWERPLSNINESSLIIPPLTIKHSDNLYLSITEANLKDWSGMYLCKDNNIKDGYRIKAKLAPMNSQRNNLGCVRLKPEHSSPWRTIIIGERPGDLIESSLILNLSDSSLIEDNTWIEPGMTAWDRWWSDVGQVNTETVKRFIKFAADMGWKYQLIDGGWYLDNPESDVTKPVPEINMVEVVNYAKDQNIKLWLWNHWTAINKQMEEAFKLYEEWGIVGVKIDYMNRDDQEMVNWYRKTVETAAKYHLMVNFHGAYKPTGLRRTYPNLMTREGVMGSEYNKWSERVTPEHNVTIPFTRMLAGPMDYTPGGFLNCNIGEFRPGIPTQVMGTRCHTLAKFIVYFSPITVACDHPDHYTDEPGLSFLKNIPTVWDETKVLNGEIGKYISIARRSGDNWFIGNMNNSTERNIRIPMDFLNEGRYNVHLYKDIKNEASNLSEENTKLTNSDELNILAEPGGGFVMRISPIR